MILNVILGRYNLKFRFASYEALDEFTNAQENRLNKMAKEMNSNQHIFQVLPEISQSFIYIIIATAKEKWQCEMI